jgi:Phage tail assembly chaperone protein, TAC
MFGDGAARLAGLSAQLLGWRPQDFWAATPADLALCLAALAPSQTHMADAATLAQLKEQFPDG